jgi:hypothetical protein
MTRTQFAVLLAPLVLVLTACVPNPPAQTTPDPTVEPSVTATEEPHSEEPIVDAAGPELRDANDFLVSGALNEDPDGDGVWEARYAFYADAQHAIRCDIWIFSGDDPALECAVAPEARDLVTYSLPNPVPGCDMSADSPTDGYSLYLSNQGFGSKAFWAGCAEYLDYSGDEVPVKVLQNNQTILVEPFTCLVNHEVAECTYTDGSGTIWLGLGTASTS